MYPSLLAEETKDAVTEYLATTFALADEDVRESLQSFLQHRQHGIFKGPYLRLRTPFESAGDVKPALSWLPEWFRPYRHQARAFERLSTFNQRSEPTVVTTGTGSGKTESFLYPLLDHARRAKQHGETGIKALILYPMNALVTDQAARLAQLLHDEPALADVTAGVYIGGTGVHHHSTREALVDNRDTLRETPPDIMLTNYKMLDLLLLRSQDAGLWKQARSSLHYIVLDEFHTYDGAQGTDVAMLLRRLGSTLHVAQSGRPLGRITPVATSATLGGGARTDELREFAETVFGTPFEPDSVITEERLPADDVIGEIDFNLDLPDIDALTLSNEPDADDDNAWIPVAEAFFGATEETSPAIRDRYHLSQRLRQHFLTGLVTRTLSHQALPVREAVDEITRSGALKWGVANRQNPQAVQNALLQFITLISAAKTDGPSGPQPFLQVEVQLWIREVSRMLRSLSRQAAFAWWHDGPPDDESHWLPAVYCRACGHSGWQALAPELGTTLEGNVTAVWRSAINPADRAKVRTLVLADPDDPDIRWLDPATLEISIDNTGDSSGLLPVLVTPDDEAATAQRCPSCGTNDAIRFLGSAVATLLSVALTQAFGSRLIPDGEKKTLVFTDSVQDAAHRASFIEGRAFTFNFRSLLYRVLDGRPTSLEIAASRLAELDDSDLYAVAPPDFTGRLALDGEWLGGKAGQRARALLTTRLAFQTQLEAGLRSRMGRTMELTGTTAIYVDTDLAAAAALAREEHLNLPQLSLSVPPPEGQFQRWILGLLDRLRIRGGIIHPWLRHYINDDGRRWAIWGRSPAGMQKFPTGRRAPIFFTTANGTEFDSLTPRAESWLTSWTIRCLGVSSAEAKALLERVIVQLTAEDGPLEQLSTKKGARAFGLKPERVILEPVRDDDLAAGRALLVCGQCDHLQPTSTRDRPLWDGAVCPRMNCPGTLQPKPVTEDNFYRDLYRSGRTRRIVTHEHTGLLKKDERENVETDFKSGQRPIDPNILTCTPTLELGIDIGELSTVTLASLPRSASNYLQRVGRAGRSTGNAFVLATVPSRPRDLYYFADPRNLIDGEVRPPGAYLNATELLERQFIAFCLDKVAAGDIHLGQPMPNLLGGLIGSTSTSDGLADGSWLRDFLDAIGAQADQLVTEFIGLFGTHVDEPAATALKEYATGNLESSIDRAIRDWRAHRDNLDERINALAENIAALDPAGHLDDQQQDDRRRWSGELKGLRNTRSEMGRRPALSGLVELGLLPNYNLMDDATTLDVRLWWTSDDADISGSSGASFQTIEHSIPRGSRTALTELAPGATFYAYGSKVQINALDIGPSGRPAWFTMRLCPDCGWGGDDQPVASCPRCGSSAAADTGACHTVLPLTRVSAEHHRDEAVVDDESEDRIRARFTTVTGVSARPEDIVSAWRLTGIAFGAEYIRSATIRSINLGRATQPGGQQVTIAAHNATAPGFRTCSQCGVVALEADLERVKHRGWCPTRKTGADPGWTRLFLTHELDTQAVRLLLPMSTLHVESRLASFSAALMLGLRDDFGGDPQHLSTLTASLPDSEGHRRQFIVLHDLVPGGTGYLDRFANPADLRRILDKARAILATCPCKDVPEQRACHRCLLSTAAPNEIEIVDRQLALTLLDEILEGWQPEALSTITDIEIRDVVLSELEVKFREELKRWVDAHTGDGHSCQIRYGPGGEELDLQLSSTDTVRRWRVEQQPDISGDVTTRPDLMITRQDAQGDPIAIYLDGQQYHASVEHNRTADDARKRDWLREQGYRVWAVTWDDVADFAASLDGRLVNENHFASRTLAAHLANQLPDRRIQSMWHNPIEFLLNYLIDPEDDIWGKAAAQSVIGLIEQTAEHGEDPYTAVEAGRLTEALLAAARDQQLSGNSGNLIIVPRTGVSGLPMFVVGKPQGGDPTAGLGVLAVLDDSQNVVGGKTHQWQWRDWLRWANILQFLARPAFGDDRPDRMAAIWTTGSLEYFAEAAQPLVSSTGTPEAGTHESSGEWKQVIEFTDESLSPVAVYLDAAGLHSPEPGGEVGPESWQLEYAWTDEKVAVVIDDDDHRDAWLAENHWKLIRGHAYESPEEMGQTVLEAVRRGRA